MRDVPVPLFRWLQQRDLLEPAQILDAGDGFFMITRSLSAILHDVGITTFPCGSSGRTLHSRLFFDDWYLCAVADGETCACSLVKLREQETDLARGLSADADIPGVTVSFVALDTELFCRCLESPGEEERCALGEEINRVVAWTGQRHHESLKAYFLRPQSRGAYLIARLYVRYLATHAADGQLPIPACCRMLLREYRDSGKKGRIPRFLEDNNRAAGTTVCSDTHIFLRDPAALTPQEELALLATHTGNVSYHAFAAEVLYHARFLLPCARVPLPLLGSVYDSAIRADMSVQDRTQPAPRPYHREESKLVRQMQLCHPELPEFTAVVDTHR